ncbi:MAG: hypothetical protein JWQ30_620 [Sediminibacterium sp.]|nr:hypothetical protein [Sediminibacterium sp.]
MNLKHRLYLICLLAALTLSAWLMTVTLHFIIPAVIADSIEPFGRLNKVQQATVVLMELGFIHLCNLMRRFVVKESLFALAGPLRWRFTSIVLYATVLWLGCLIYLSFHLWRIPAVYKWDILIELLVLTLGMAVMLGIALPFSASRCWLFVWKRGMKF